MDRNNTGQVKWTSDSSNEIEKKDVGPKYSRFSESLRHVAPSTIQCSVFCGGRQCKYENPVKMKDEEMAIKGLYSSWVTSNILATARPSTEIIKKYDVIRQFSRKGIKSLMNLQHPGEHASCGFGLEDSGFSYIPEDFMQQDIFFYNFGWNDYGVRSLESILDMVKVMSFALKEGKAAVHCHAGLGRTGVLIACYLVFSERIEADEAIHRVRSNRPKAVQTRGQIACVHDFTNFLTHLWIVFSSHVPGAKKFSLLQYITRQRHLLHGEESRHLKYIPKLVYLLCCRLLEVAGVKDEDTPLNWTLSQEVKAAFAEADESEIHNGSAGLSSLEDLAHAVRHSPYVDPSVKSSQTSMLQHVPSIEEGEASQGRTLPDLDQRDVGLLRHSESSAYERHSSDSCIFPGSHSGLWENESILPSVRRTRLEPLNWTSKGKDKNKQGKQLPTLRSHTSGDGSGDRSRTKEQDAGFLCATQTNVGQSAVQERISVAKALAASACADTGVHNRTERLKRKLNAADCWQEIGIESDPWVLTRLLWSWLEELVEPVVKEEEVSLLEEHISDPVGAVKRLKRGERDTVECLVTTICELEPLRKELADRVLRRTAVVLTHNKELPLTLSKASLDRSAELPGAEAVRSQLPHSPNRRGNSEEREDEVASVPESLLRSPSYRLLIFLRQLVRALKGGALSSGHYQTLGAHAKFTNYAFNVDEFMRLIYKAAYAVKENLIK